MRKKKTTQYLILAAASLVIGVACSVILAISLAGMSTPYKEAKNGVDEIVDRTSAVLGSDSGSEVAKIRIGSGVYSVGDYVIRSFTSPEYLSLGKSDSEFAADLVAVAEGSSNSEAEADIVSDLEDHSRMYVIDKYLSDINRRYAATTDISSDPGDSFTDCVISKPLESGDTYTLGIRKVEGTFDATGDGVRTDFFVDGVLYQGNIRIEEADGSGKNFVMAWDTAGVESGEHSVLILLRSSDGRGQIIAGGDITVPRCMVLNNDMVQLGSIDRGQSVSWYILNAQDRDAYVNFVGLGDDIKVSLYDAYGEFIGTNDLPGSNYEVLRGHMQDIEAIKADTGIPNVNNNFFVKVERGELCSSSDEPVSYTMVQSRNVAYYDGRYMAVIDDVGAVPTPLPVSSSASPYNGTDVRLSDLNNNITEVPFEDIRFLPISGFLTNMDINNNASDSAVNVFPQFAVKTTDYGYYTTTLNSVALDITAQEGYASTVSVTVINNGISSGVDDLSSIAITEGENTIDISVTAFDGAINNYKIYILKGDDNGSFSEDTLSLFPTSYYDGLWLLHSLHPDYIFRPYNTGLDFAEVLDYEDSADRSLANIYSHPAWCKSGSPEYDGGGWYAATNEVVQYFLDPRNYLDPQHIFSFELLSFDGSVQTVDGVRNIVNGSFLADTSEYDYAQIIFDAGRTANVSPYFLASRILQEMGYNGESALCHGTLAGYEGYYNFYNIGSVPDPSIQNGALINGARYAMWGADPDEEEISPVEAELMLPWNSVDRAITGGALWIASRYTAAGQDTLYFQKFDVIDNEDGLYMHQYAQNISMAYTEGARYFNGYASIDMLDNPFVFLIPVYNDMPSEFGVMPYSGA